MQMPLSKQCAQNARQQQRQKQSDERRANGDRPDDRAVCIDRAARQQRHAEHRPADRDGGKQHAEHRQQDRRAALIERQTEQQERNDLDPRQPQHRYVEHRQQGIHRAADRKKRDRDDARSNPRQRRREQKDAAVHQRIVEQKPFDDNLHRVTRSTITD